MEPCLPASHFSCRVFGFSYVLSRGCKANSTCNLAPSPLWFLLQLLEPDHESGSGTLACKHGRVRDPQRMSRTTFEREKQPQGSSCSKTRQPSKTNPKPTDQISHATQHQLFLATLHCQAPFTEPEIDPLHLPRVRRPCY